MNILDLYKKNEEAYQHLMDQFRKALSEGDELLAEAIMSELEKLNVKLRILMEVRRESTQD